MKLDPKGNVFSHTFFRRKKVLAKTSLLIKFMVTCNEEMMPLYPCLFVYKSKISPDLSTGIDQNERIFRTMGSGSRPL